jgi:hypothetical protein
MGVLIIADRRKALRGVDVLVQLTYVEHASKRTSGDESSRSFADCGAEFSASWLVQNNGW